MSGSCEAGLMLIGIVLSVEHFKGIVIAKPFSMIAQLWFAAKFPKF